MIPYTRVKIALTSMFGNISGQILLVIFACAAVVAANGIAQSIRPSGDYWSAFTAWLLGVLALGFALIYLPARGHSSSLRARMLNARVEILLVAGLTVIAFILRVIDLQNIPYPFAGDEGSVGTEAVRILTGQATNMFVTGWSSEPMMSFLPYAASLAVVGPNIFGLRIVAVLVGTLTIPTLYLLARSLFNEPIVAWFSALLLAAMSPHIHFSRIAVNNIAAPFFACLVFWLLSRALETRKMYWFAMAGIAAGASIYSYAGTRFVLIIAGIYLLYASATDSQIRRQWLKLAIFGLSAGVTLFPIAIYFWQHPDIAFARLNQMGIFQNGWLASEMLKTHESAPLIFASLLVNSFLVIISTPAVYGLWNSPRPLLDTLWAFFFIVGFIFSLSNLRERRQVLLQLWFWSVIVVGGALIVPPPAAARFTMVFPAITLFSALGIWNIVSLLKQTASLLPVAVSGLMLIIALILAGSSLNFYFVEYIPKHYYTDVNSEVGMELGKYLATAPRDAKVYFMGEPRMFVDFPSIPYLSHGLDAMNVDSGSNVKDIVEANREAIFVALPDHRAALDRIRTTSPNGTYSETFRRTVAGEILYLLYVVPNRPL